MHRRGGFRWSTSMVARIYSYLAENKEIIGCVCSAAYKAHISAQHHHYRISGVIGFKDFLREHFEKDAFLWAFLLSSCWRKTLKYSDTWRQDVALLFTDACKRVVESWRVYETSNSFVLPIKPLPLNFRDVSMLDALFASRNFHPLKMLSEHILKLRKKPVYFI